MGLAVTSGGGERGVGLTPNPAALPQVGLAATSRGGEPRDAALGGAPFHAQGLAALGLAGAGAEREVELGGLPPVDERLLVPPPGPPRAAVHTVF